MLSISDDGKYVVTVDETGCLFCFDLLTGGQLWSVRMEKEDGYRTADDVLMLEILDRQQSVFYADDNYTYVLSLLTGETLYKMLTADFTPDDYYSDNDGCSICLSPDESVFIFYPTTTTISDANTSSSYVIYRTKDLTALNRIDISSEVKYETLTPCFSPDGKYLAIFTSEYYPLRDHQLTTSIINIENEENLISHTLKGVYFNRDDVAANVTWLSDGSLLLQYLVESTMTEHQMKFYHWTGQSDLSFYNAPVLTINNTDTDCKLMDVLTTDDYVYYIYSSYIVSVAFDGDTNDWFSSDLKIEYHYDISTDSLIAWYIDQSDSLVLIYNNGETESLSGYSNIPKRSNLPDINMKIRQSVIPSVSNKLALIPETNQNCIYVLEPSSSFAHKELSDILLTPNHKTTKQIHVALSSDYQKLAAYDVDTLLRNEYALTIYDTASFEAIKQISLSPEQTGLHFSGFSADSSKLYLYQYAFDLSTGDLSYLPGTVFPTSGVQNTDTIFFTQFNWSPASTELIWQRENEDPKAVPIPDDIQQKLLKTCEETGPKYPPVYSNSGLIVGRHFVKFLADSTRFYSIYSIEDDQWQLINNPSPAYGVPVIAVGAANQWIAFADYDQMLRIYDFDATSVIKEYPMSGVSPDAVMQVQFILEDKVVLIVEDTGILTAIRTADGAILGRFTLDLHETQWTYHYDWKSPQPITLQVDEKHNDLYVGSYNGRTGGLRIDLDTWSVLAEIPGLICYIPSNNHIIQFDAYYEKLYACPVYSIEELIAQGKALLNLR